MILYCSSLADGHEHDEENLPLLVAGRGGGVFNTGLLVRFHDETSLSDLHLLMLRRLGVPADRFGESITPMTEIMR